MRERKVVDFGGEDPGSAGRKENVIRIYRMKKKSIFNKFFKLKYSLKNPLVKSLMSLLSFKSTIQADILESAVLSDVI